MGRTITITVHSARDLRNADEDEGGETDAFVIVCFDNKVNQELGRTETVTDTSDPQWDHTFDVDISSHIQNAIDETGEEPQMMTFCVYDCDETEGAEPLGVAGINFADLVKKGRYEGDLDVFEGMGTVNVTVEMKQVKKGSMLKDNAALKIAGGVAGVAALGAIGAYLYNRQEKKKAKLTEEEVPEDEMNTGLSYGANIDDDDDDDEDKDNFKKWWEMDDESSGDEDDNRWC